MGVCVCVKERVGREVAPWASRPLIAQHGLAHTAFGIGGDEAGYCTDWPAVLKGYAMVVDLVVEWVLLVFNVRLH